MTPGYKKTLKSLFARAQGPFKLGLEAPRALLQQLGNPQRQVRSMVVAGTNGKGSTSHLMATALQHAGHRVGLFTSPHLLRFTERIRVNGEEIPQDQVVHWYQTIEKQGSEGALRPSFFECTTAMALAHFARARVDIAILEVGLGGRLDATRCADPFGAVLTPIALDHQHILGQTIAAIAAEKAAIIPQGGLAVVAPQPAEALAVVREFIHRQNATAVESAHAHLEGGVLHLRHQEHTLRLKTWPPGDYQPTNIATAWAACRALGQRGSPCPDRAFEAAVAAFDWPGRYQWLAPDLLVDAAHNEAGAQALVASLPNDPRSRDRDSGARRPIHCVFSSLKTKACAAMLDHLRPHIRHFYTSALPLPRSQSAEALQALLPQATLCETPHHAIDQARTAAGQDGGIVLVTGSLFLVAEALALSRPEDRDPPIDA